MAIYLSTLFSLSLNGDGTTKEFVYDITKAPLFTNDPGEPSDVLVKASDGPNLGVDATGTVEIADNIPVTVALKKSTITLNFERAPLAPGFINNALASALTVTDNAYTVQLEFRYNSN
ncbi:MAG TPA: hypothetical protein VGK36_08800 [Candidatus Angelobacter sp.]|jgi:hypothetical protein